MSEIAKILLLFGRFCTFFGRFTLFWPFFTSFCFLIPLLAVLHYVENGRFTHYVMSVCAKKAASNKSGQISSSESGI